MSTLTLSMDWSLAPSHFDNSPENQPFENGAQLPAADVGWGDGTNDEMCLGILYIFGV